MNLFNKIILVFVANFVALFLSASLLSGFHVTNYFIPAAVVVGILTLVHVLLKPILEALLSPLIILTLGLGYFLINAAVLYVVDIFSDSIRIDTLANLFWSTCIFLVANAVVLTIARLGNK